MSNAHGTSGTASISLTGRRGDPSYFRFEEREGFCPELIVDLLHGRLAGVVFRDVVSSAVCAELTSRFLGSPARRARGPAAPGEYVGAYHAGKTTESYLDDTAAVGDAVARILDIPDSPLAVLQGGLAEVLAKDGVDLRVARQGNREACPAIVRSWRGKKEFALAPHEDLSQCGDPQQKNFEIQRAADHHIVAMNICLENGGGGRLVVWNIEPDLESRQHLGLEHTGVPYPVECLDGVEMMSLDVRPGDIYLFNGAHVHAVEPSTDASVRRITMSGFFGFIDRRTVVSWT
jgi:hypothetical protein